MQAVQRRLREPLQLAAELGSAGGPRLVAVCASLADRLDSASSMRAALEQLQASVTVRADALLVELSATALLTMVGAAPDHAKPEQRLTLQMPTLLKRRGHELRLVYAAPDANPARRDERMIRLIASSHDAYDQLLASEGRANSSRRSTLARLARLKFLAPDIVTAIVEGRQPAELTSRTLLRLGERPLSWDQQRRLLGFG